jgi:hypothetical protein
VGVTADGVSLDQVVQVGCDVPGVPEVDAVVECDEGDGDVAVVLANVDGTEPIEFVVTDPRDGSTVTKSVEPGGSTSVVLEGFADGSHTIEVTADGVSVDQSVQVACDRPGEPEVGASVECVGGDGDVTVTLSNVGGDLDVEFVVTDPRDGSTVTRVVSVGETTEVVLPGLADGSYTIEVTADGVSVDQSVQVACDRPGVPEVVSGVECVDGDGVVVVALGNVEGNQPVRFVVVDPRDGSEV